MVEENGSDIMANRHDLLNGQFYDPTGNLISEVNNRTGKQILCYSNGTPSWELDVLNGKYTHVKMWHRNGQLSHECHYQNGNPHGSSVSYYPNVQIRFRGEYSNGNRTGVWKRYTEGGVMESETNEDVE